MKLASLQVDGEPLSQMLRESQMMTLIVCIYMSKEMDDGGFFHPSIPV